MSPTPPTASVPTASSPLATVPAEARDLLDEVVDLRRDIHRHPELGLANPRTRDLIVAALDGLGLEVSVGDDELTSVVADLAGEGGDGPTVLLRADTDALPMDEDTDVEFRSCVTGAAHACGHDAHVAMLVGAARLLAARRAELPGRVRFMFQPGEEGFGGAAEMVAAGVLDGVDAAYALHITPNIPAGFAASRPGSIMASADTFHIEIVGRGGHASTPHFCCDPVPIAAEVITGLQTLVTRELNAFDPAVVSVTRVEAGTTTNVIPERAVLEGTIRAVSETTRLHVHEALPRLVRSVAAAHGADAEVRVDAGYPVTVNDAGAVDLVAGAARRVLGEDRWFELPAPVMGAEDFSYVTAKVPGAMTFLGVCPDDIADSLTAPPCHSNRMRLHEPALADGVALHVATALTALGVA